MLGNPELERALLEQTYDGVMTVTGTSKQEPWAAKPLLHRTRCCTRISRVRCRFRAHRTAKRDANSGQISYQADDLLCAGL